MGLSLTTRAWPAPWYLEVNDAADALAGVHQLEGLVDLAQPHGVGDEVIQLELAGQVALDDTRQLGAALDARNNFV